LLTRGSDLVDLAPKALEVLSVLVTNAGAVVCKDDLLSLVWPDTVVEEGNLAVHVSSLRKALVGHEYGSSYIETVPKRGYRFTAPVHQVLKTEAIPPNDASALYRVAEHYIQQQTAEACRRAAAICEKCIEDDPLSGKARVGLADSLILRFILGDVGREEGAGAAVALLTEANKIQPGCPEVHLSLSRVHCIWDWQWQKAGDETQYAFELARDHTTKLMAQAWQGSYLARVGDLDRGLRQLRQACMALPLSPIVWSFLADAHFLARDFRGSAAATKEALHLHPNCWYLHRAAAKAHTMLGDYAEALRHLRLARLLNAGPKFGLLWDIAYVHALAGRRENAIRLLTRIEGVPSGLYDSPVSLAKVLAALGDKDRAMDNIEGACAARDWYISGLKRDCRLDPLRSDSRFRRVLSQVGI
jgi:DNA-binding winged helix-turn-helix (wHTH) protein